MLSTMTLRRFQRRTERESPVRPISNFLPLTIFGKGLVAFFCARLHRLVNSRQNRLEGGVLVECRAWRSNQLKTAAGSVPSAGRSSGLESRPRCVFAAV